MSGVSRTSATGSDLKGSTTARLTSDLYGAAVSLNDPQAQRQTQAGSHAGRFGGEKGLQRCAPVPGGACPARYPPPLA